MELSGYNSAYNFNTRPDGSRIGTAIGRLAGKQCKCCAIRVYDGVAGIDLNVTSESMLHTLRHDVFTEPDGTVYVQTGDIPAMWLRDSAAQIKPYVPFVSSLPALGPVVRGVIERNARNVVPMLGNPIAAWENRAVFIVALATMFAPSSYPALQAI